MGGSMSKDRQTGDGQTDIQAGRQMWHGKGDSGEQRSENPTRI